MSVQWEHRSEPDTAPIVGAGWLLSLAAAVVALPIDGLLRGMVAAGQGLQAIIDYLDLSRTALEEHIVRLGLPMPHDRARRRACGRNPWLDDDVRRLIAWRLAGVHPETIALRLGRSVGSIRSKSRRLGVPAPARKVLRRLDPQQLDDPPLDLWSGLSADCAVPASPVSRCGTVAGAPLVPAAPSTVPSTPAFVAEIKSAARADQGALALTAAQTVERAAAAAKAPTVRTRGSRVPGRRPEGQRELNLLRVIGGTESGKAEVPVPQEHRAVDFSGDLTWMAQMTTPAKNEIFVWTLGLLFLSGMHWRKIAERIGHKPGAVRTMRTRFGIPIASDRRLLTTDLDDLRAKMTCVVSGYILKFCNESGTYFWCHRDDRFCNTAPMVRRRKGLRDQRIEGRSPVFKLLSRAQIDRLPRHLVEPFANNERIVGLA